MIAGLVLAGGKSLRFGSEKAGALFEGRPLLDWSLDLLTDPCEALAVSAAADSEAARLAHRKGVPVLVDGPGDPDGPLSGVKAGLVWASSLGAAWLAVVPCDTPRLPDDLVTRLRDGMGAAPAAFAETSGGQHPLCSIWSVALLRPLSDALAERHPPARRFLADVGAAMVWFEPADAFANMNRPGDL